MTIEPTQAPCTFVSNDISQPKNAKNDIQRIDSGATEDSPFGSSLTTPVDENIQPFDGIEGRLFAKNLSTSLGLSSDATWKLQGQNRKFSMLGAHGPESTVYDISAETHISRPRSSSLYSLPNVSIALEDGPNCDCGINAKASPIESPLANNEIEDRKACITRQLCYALPFADATLPWEDAQMERGMKLTFKPPLIPPFQYVVAAAIRIVIFLPWCAVVGGAILFFPGQLDLIAFGPGYFETPYGIHRFAHWANYAVHHVSIFVALIVSIGWLSPALGLLVFAGLAAQFFYAWQDFVMDEGIPLGWDNRQMMYLIGTDFVRSGALNLCKKDSYYFASLGQKEDVEDDSDEEF